MPVDNPRLSLPHREHVSKIPIYRKCLCSISRGGAGGWGGKPDASIAGGCAWQTCQIYSWVAAGVGWDTTAAACAVQR
jgi:hypothetical protein